MSSPGLLIPQVIGGFRAPTGKNGLTTPASVFDHTMSLAGYTTEGRTKNPHRGSSVKRSVEDMFDSNVKFTLHFPKIVPDSFIRDKKSSADAAANGTHEGSLPQRLMDSFAPSSRSKKSKKKVAASGKDSTSKNGAGKKRKLPTFSRMVPLSLTAPYPETYIKKRLDYVQKVKQRYVF